MMAGDPLSIVVRRRIKPGSEAAFETAMRQFIGFTLAFPGNRGINVLRPAEGGDRVYTVLDRFADPDSRKAFTADPEYARWMQRLGEFSDGEPQIAEIGGLGGWFTARGTPSNAQPSSLKMAAVTFLGVYPLTSTLPGLFTYLLPGWQSLAVNAVATAAIVAALTWVVMPLLTRLFARWLFGSSP